MNRLIPCLCSSFLIILLSFQMPAQTTLSVEGLTESVEIVTDVWGIPHIYAQNQRDLFFAQGYYAAKDRLFQFEVWRRQATGTVAEILGPRELERDIGTRLFKFRGDMNLEMNHYHPDGVEIIQAYVDGVNAYIDYVWEYPDELPIEFRLLDIEPKKWTPAVVVSRHQGLLGNIEDEMDIARAVSILGEEKVKEIAWFHPGEPSLTIDPKINQELLFDDILNLYRAFRKPVEFRPEDITAALRSDLDSYSELAMADEEDYDDWSKNGLWDIGSNNWVVDGSRTESGFPMMANDPHRRQSVPSLRYMAHLVAPGWNVIGGGEPEIPGISIGHNEHGAWGLTVFRTDAEDLYVYDLNPNHLSQYRYQGKWENMTLIKEMIPVKGLDSIEVDLMYTRHGPVTHIDSTNHVAYAVRCGWLEIGGSPYLASLRMNQATNFEEFREACQYSHIPGENMVWADREGNIGWQAVGIAPVRRNWSGLVPVPGDGTYEWDGYLPIMMKPNLYNPSDGIINTSNENVIPQGYEFMDAMGYSWSDPYRGDRVREFLLNGRQHSLMDMAKLQTDYLSIPARQLLPLVLSLDFADPALSKAKTYLAEWDYQLAPGSIAAAIYHEFENQVWVGMNDLLIPQEARPFLQLQMKRIIEYLSMPGAAFGTDPLKGRDNFLAESMEEAVATLIDRLGDDMGNWKYGQENLKHIVLKHPLSNAVNPDLREKLDLGPIPRGGNSYSVNNTGYAYNQLSGASFRLIVDTANWDHSIGTNSPGQSGNPDHPHYDNLFETWGLDKFFPVYYSKDKIESTSFHRLILRPNQD